jgi:hypothetical protein
LAPDRLTIAKAEFDAMLRDGTARRSRVPDHRLSTSFPRRTTVGVHAVTKELLTPEPFPTDIPSLTSTITPFTSLVVASFFPRSIE